MASNTTTRTYADNTTQAVRRATRQGRRKQRDTVKVLVRVPAEYLALMKWENEKCGGNNKVTAQIVDAIRASLCGCVYTQLLKQ